ncbi:MAG: nickel pincer cofactor biosynthesis protein LarB [Pseudomonadales bacterium]|nr:nickel pincer cofactor biosynthesis protein LarB [Pseudomonadales bacterium]
MVSEITLDFDRHTRTGLSEALMCSGKSLRQLQSILDEVQHRQAAMLLTRLDASRAAALKITGGSLDYDEISQTAFYQAGEACASVRAEVAVISGGSSDVPVAREALRTLAFYGVEAQEIHDIGVAGLWRLQMQLQNLSSKSVIVCVAGMDAALPTVLAGLVPGLVIAVPTSVGYGMARQGETALNALLCSCAQGLVVVNIDNGFGAACAAMRALRMQHAFPGPKS